MTVKITPRTRTTRTITTIRPSRSVALVTEVLSYAGFLGPNNDTRSA
jgi:hypothetical protein